MERIELITSREYWVGIIHLRLWTVNGSIERDSERWEKMAEIVVDEYFMKSIKELSDNR